MDRVVGDIATTPMKLLAMHHPERYRRMAEAYERKTRQKAPTVDDWKLVEEERITIRAAQCEHLNGKVVAVAKEWAGSMNMLQIGHATQ